MRRVVAVATLVLTLIAWPSRADAYFWKWLDDLSGPQFVGFVAEWRVYCKAESAASEREALLRLQSSLDNALKKHADAAKNAKSPAAKKYFGNAVLYSKFAFELVKEAINELDSNSTKDVSRLVMVALVWRGHADDHYDWGKKLERGERVDEGKAPKEQEVPEVEFTVRTFVVGGGISFSLCDAKPLHRDKRYLNVSIGWGYDTKDDNHGQGNRMVLFGASYHGVVTPYLTVGTGAGLASFSSTNQQSVQRLYVQPWIVDFKPGGLRRNAQFHGPLWHVFFLRYSTIIFPAGFEPGQFGGVSPRYRAELVHSLGFHADMAPLIRSLQKRW